MNADDGPKTQLRPRGQAPIGVDRTPFDLIGGRDAVLRLSERFYDEMEKHEPALARLHPQGDAGKVSRGSRDRFALFLVGWLGGPQDYVAAHGHPRLRMRHGRVPVDIAMRDAWLRAMGRALEGEKIEGELKAYLEARFAEVADFMRNQPG